ncbi:hypothetical protein L2E82_01046 [Cichorium intybus]|uniref:Uncharacterized protein n=1 Tax=Cichorium intybus TaxID=13427 RepID=A0ACB9GYI1_CICIN|nr:hypothetical protein L2E82_01046 [Cichorium intybus]
MIPLTKITLDGSFKDYNYHLPGVEPKSVFNAWSSPVLFVQLGQDASKQSRRAETRSDLKLREDNWNAAD